MDAHLCSSRDRTVVSFRFSHMTDKSRSQLPCCWLAKENFRSRLYILRVDNPDFDQPVISRTRKHVLRLLPPRILLLLLLLSPSSSSSSSSRRRFLFLIRIILSTFKCAQLGSRQGGRERAPRDVVDVRDAVGVFDLRDEDVPGVLLLPGLFLLATAAGSSRVGGRGSASFEIF